MLEWIKEYKNPILIAIVVSVLFGFYVISTFFGEVEGLEEGGWEEIEPASPIEEDIETETQVVPEEIVVDVKGAVHVPGVYKALVGERVIDLIEKAGGITENANSKAINFALRVTDEMVVYVPMIGEELEGIGETVTTPMDDGEGGKVNLNKASQSELETLPGIGPAKAKAIIDYREKNGPFKAIEGIRSISGFGEKTFEKLKDHISVK